jgi:hypothetical protein
MKWPVFPSIPYKVTLIGKHTSCQIEPLQKTSFSFKNVDFTHESKKTHRQANSFSWINGLEYWRQNFLAWVLKSSSPSQSSNTSRKTQEHQEHFMVFGKDFDQTLRTNLAMHNWI